MTKETYKIRKDASGREYIISRQDKNHTATDKPDDTVCEGK